MVRKRTSLLFAACLAVTGTLYAAYRPQRLALADDGTTPGQLTILGKDGQPAGLCPLKMTDVTADISGIVARVTVKQEFNYPNRTPIEAVYTFPLPPDAAVDNMMMTIGTRVVKGEIKRREEARQIYEAAKAQGQAAALLDQERPNIFTQSVANIMPGESVRITISYVNLLKYDDGNYEFTFPMVVGPRFVPGGGYAAPRVRGAAGVPSARTGAQDEPVIVKDGDKISSPITSKGTRAGHTIRLAVNLDAGIPIQSLDSKLHAIDVWRNSPSRAMLRLRSSREIPNKDFVLRYRAAGNQIQSGLLAHAIAKPLRDRQGRTTGTNTNGYFTLVLQPPSAPEQSQVTRKEMVFVIDQTGSQSGWPIEKAKETTRHCIKNLNPGDTFQLIGFNTEIYPCFPEPVEANETTIKKALDFLNPLQGSGGTDILKSVDYALRIPDDPDRLRIVCYMTDGYVGNDMQIIDYIRRNRGRARIFPFGVGNSVNSFLIDSMAREGKGAAQYVYLNDNGEAAAAKFTKRIASPLLRDIEVDWNGFPVEDVYPKAIPDVFSAQPIVLKGRYTGTAEGEITVRGLLRGQPWSTTVRVSLPAEKRDGAAIPTLWAREKIEDLMAEDWLGAQKGQAKPEIQEQVVQTALEYRLMTQYTSFVAVEQRVVNVGGKQRTLEVPVEMPEGVSYEGIFGKDRELRRMDPGAAAVGRSLHFYASSLRESKAAAVDRLSLSDTAPPEPEKPEVRRDRLRAKKVAPELETALKSAKPAEVQLWLSGAPMDWKAKLKAAGFSLEAELMPGRLLLGKLDPKKLDALLALEFVRRVEKPKYR